jgi:hypothetical protein
VSHQYPKTLMFSNIRMGSIPGFSRSWGTECPRFYNPADYLIEELAVNQQ